MSTTTRPHIIYVLGGQGSGKGSICGRLLVDFPSFIHTSIGDALRREILTPGTQDGPIIEHHMRNGTLIPWDMILKYLLKELDQYATPQGMPRKIVLLDGFPRMLEQAMLFEEFYKPEFVVFLDCGRELMLERTLNRQATSGRVDDNQESFEKRIEGFYQDSLPVVNYLDAQGKVIKINSSGTIEETYAMLKLLFVGRLNKFLPVQVEIANLPVEGSRLPVDS